jgi:IMP dehydrogenase
MTSERTGRLPYKEGGAAPKTDGPLHSGNTGRHASFNDGTHDIPMSLTFDDVLLMPLHSRVLPHETNIETQFTRQIRLKMPLISAAMDTVTEAATAIAMAQAGGIGVIHKNLSITDQAREVRQVKKSEAGMVTQPITVSSAQTVGDIIEIMGRFNISGLPVVDDGALVGIVTGRDIRFEKNHARPVREVMTADVIKTRRGISTEEAIEILHKHRIEKLPVLDEAGKILVGLYTIKDIQKSKRFPNASKDEAGRLLVAAAIGAGGDYLDRCAALLDAGADAIIVDTAHGHSQGVLDAVANVRKQFSRYNFEIIGGNVATGDATLALIEAGVDAVKVGVGPGSICTTRIVTGIGVPQLSAVMDCARAARGTGVPIIADGGIKYSGDVVKALAGGGDTVMIGSLFAGTEEAPGELVIYQGKSYKSYRGMGSIGAMAKGSKDRYFQGDVSDSGKFVPEGIEGRVAYKGPLANSLHQLLGGIRSAMGYIGAGTITDLQERARFQRISPAGLRESHVHDVYITREAPNYKLD